MIEKNNDKVILALYPIKCFTGSEQNGKPSEKNLNSCT
jgi:hypothetical protein